MVAEQSSIGVMGMVAGFRPESARKELSRTEPPEMTAMNSSEDNPTPKTTSKLLVKCLFYRVTTFHECITKHVVSLI